MVDRKTGQPRTIYVPTASVSVTGGIQPGILDRVLGSEHRESGLLARLLLAMPPRRAKRWTETEISSDTEELTATIFDGLFALQSQETHNGEPCPQVVELSADGRRAWVEFYESHAAEQVELDGDLSAAWSKLEGYAARLALVVHLVRCVARGPSLRDPNVVDADSIAAGVKMVRWFANEALRLYARWMESDEDAGRRRLVETIQRKGGGSHDSRVATVSLTPKRFRC